MPRRAGASIPVPPTLPPLRPVGNTAPPPVAGGAASAPTSAPGMPTLMLTPATPAAKPPEPAAKPAAPPSIVLAPELDMVPDPPIVPPGPVLASQAQAIPRPLTPVPAQAPAMAMPPTMAMPPAQAYAPPAEAYAPPAQAYASPQPPFVPPTPAPGFAPFAYGDPGIPVPATPEGQPAPAVWRQAHPSAQRWAERRQKSSVAAGAAVPSPPRMALGLLIAGIGVWLLVSFIPARRPLDAAEKARVSQQAGVDAGAWRFTESLHGVALGGAAVYLAIGLLVALRGAMFRRGSAGARKSAIALGVAFAALTVAMVVIVAVASLGGPSG